MFKFLFGRKAEDVKVETQREVATRALSELNIVLDGLETKPAIKLDMSSGQIEIDWPDQMPDEALALPAPEEPKKEEAAKEEPVKEDPAKAEPAQDKAKDIAKSVQEAVEEGAEKVAEKAA